MKDISHAFLGPETLAHLEKGRRELDLEWLDLDLYAEAMTTNAYGAEQKHHPFPSQHRLEYIGDAVLSLVVRSSLAGILERSDVGHLSALCQTIVSNVRLDDVGKRLGLDRHLLPAKGKPSLADTYEALIGACFMGGGYEQAAAFIKRTYLDVVFSRTP